MIRNVFHRCNRRVKRQKRFLLKSRYCSYKQTNKIRPRIEGNTPQEVWKLKQELAALYRICAILNFNEGIDNHITFSLPNNKAFLVFPMGLHWSEVTASDILTVDMHSCEVLDRDEHDPDDRVVLEPTTTAFYLHSRVHLSNPEARCLIHTHMPYATTLTCVKGGELQMIHQNSMRYNGDIAYDWNYKGLILDKNEGDRLAKIMGKKAVLMMANHGPLVGGATISVAFNRLYYLERSCQLQVMAMQTKKDLLIVEKDVLEEAKKYYPGEEEEMYANFIWDAYKRILENHHNVPDYRK